MENLSKHIKKYYSCAYVHTQDISARGLPYFGCNMSNFTNLSKLIADTTYRSCYHHQILYISNNRSEYTRYKDVNLIFLLTINGSQNY